MRDARLGVICCFVQILFSKALCFIGLVIFCLFCGCKGTKYINGKAKKHKKNGDASAAVKQIK